MDNNSKVNPPSKRPKRFFDIVPSSDISSPSSSSRPLIVGNQPEQTDPMVTENPMDVTSHQPPALESPVVEEPQSETEQHVAEAPNTSDVVDEQPQTDVEPIETESQPVQDSPDTTTSEPDKTNQGMDVNTNDTNDSVQQNPEENVASSTESSPITDYEHELPEGDDVGVAPTTSSNLAPTTELATPEEKQAPADDGDFVVQPVVVAQHNATKTKTKHVVRRIFLIIGIVIFILVVIFALLNSGILNLHTSSTVHNSPYYPSTN